MSASKEENHMRTMPIPALVRKTGFPLMLSLLVSSLYNIVDSIFVSYISEDALTALSMAAPVQMLMSALGCGIAVGLNAVISRDLGAGNQKKVKQTASAAIFLAVIAYVMIAISGLLLTEPFFLWQSGGNTRIFQYGIEYLRICMVFSLGTMGQWVFDRFLIATGRSSLFLVTLSVASITNLVLDPVFIFGYLGLPAMGTAGAAMATVIGQFLGSGAGIWLNLKKNREIPIYVTFRPSGSCVLNILRVGIPTMVMQGIVALTGLCMNTILHSFSSTAVAVMGICNRIQNLATIPPHGIDNGLIPIIAYNYGAKNRERIEQAIRWALIYSFAIMGAVLVLLECFPIQILSLFDASETMLGIGMPAVRILSVSYFLSVLGMVYSTVFQALNRSSYSMYLTLFRQVALPLGLALLFSATDQIVLVWTAFPLAELISIPLAFHLMNKIKKGILLRVI